MCLTYLAFRKGFIDNIWQNNVLHGLYTCARKTSYECSSVDKVHTLNREVNIHPIIQIPNSLYQRRLVPNFNFCNFKKKVLLSCLVALYRLCRDCNGMLWYRMKSVQVLAFSIYSQLKSILATFCWKVSCTCMISLLWYIENFISSIYGAKKKKKKKKKMEVWSHTVALYISWSIPEALPNPKSLYIYPCQGPKIYVKKRCQSIGPATSWRQRPPSFLEKCFGPGNRCIVAVIP